MKSLKLVVEDHGSKLKLAEDVDPSLWTTDNMLAGFPRPEQVWRWWNCENDPPPDPKTPGQAGQAHKAAEKHYIAGQKVTGGGPVTTSMPPVTLTTTKQSTRVTG